MLFSVIDAPETEFGYGIQEYSSMEQVADRITRNDELLADLEAAYRDKEVETEDYELQKNAIVEQSGIYRYLLEHNIEYHDVRSVEYIGVYAKNNASFVMYLSNLAQVFIVVICAIAALSVFSGEFQSGTARFVYCCGKKRWKIVLSKIYLIALIYIACIGIFMLFQWIFSLPYKSDFNYLLDITNTGITQYSINGFIARTMFAIIPDTAFWLLIFISVGLFFKNIYWVIAVDAGIYAVFQMIFLRIPAAQINAFAHSLINIHVNGISDGQFAVAMSIKYAAVIILLIVGIIQFQKKDLA
jgi:ABC-type transport system involved in multi-copper enzyme maturation permease subunit